MEKGFSRHLVHLNDLIKVIYRDMGTDSGLMESNRGLHPPVKLMQVVKH
jgi:hypothetical protein